MSRVKRTHVAAHAEHDDESSGGGGGGDSDDDNVSESSHVAKVNHPATAQRRSNRTAANTPHDDLLKRAGRVPKTKPKWLAPLLEYVSEGGSSTDATQLACLLTAIERHWERFSSDANSAYELVRAARPPKKKRATAAAVAASNTTAITTGTASDATMQSAADAPPEEQLLRAVQSVQDALGDKQSQSTIVNTLRSALPETVVRALSVAPQHAAYDWSRARQQSEQAYGTFCSEARKCRFEPTHPMVQSVENLYGVAKDLLNVNHTANDAPADADAEGESVSTA